MYAVEINGCALRVKVKSHKASGTGSVVIDGVGVDSQAICK